MARSRPGVKPRRLTAGSDAVTLSAVAIAFFDLDKTLLAVNSGSLWVRREFRLGYLGYAKALRATLWIARYHLGFAQLEDMVAEAIAELAGTRAADIQARTDEFYEQEVRALLRTGARAALEEHRGRHDKLVLLTSSSHYLSAHVQRDLSLDDVLCNRFEVDAQGRHTGKPLGRICFGQGKVSYAEQYAQSHGQRLADCYFYTDSFSDLPVLELVGHPVAVNPDPRLRRTAVKRGWAVQDWGGAV